MAFFNGAKRMVNREKIALNVLDKLQMVDTYFVEDLQVLALVVLMWPYTKQMQMEYYCGLKDMEVQAMTKDFMCAQ